MFVRILFFILWLPFCAQAQFQFKNVPDIPPIPDSAKPGVVKPNDTRFPNLPIPTDVVMDIPPVYERPFGVEDGPRIAVNRFIVLGFEENPKLGIYASEVRELLETYRLQALGLDNINEDGFTPTEVKSINAFIKATAEDYRGEKRTKEYEALLRELRYQRYLRSGLTIGQMQEIANKLTDFYRKKGFIVAQAVVPEQTVVDGLVEVRVLEGQLGQVAIEGNKKYTDSVIRTPFNDIVGRPVTKKQIESALLSLSDYPGLTAFGLFAKGQNVGETDLLLRVQQEDSHEFQLHFDTQGTDSTGEDRTRFTYNWNNPFKRGDIFEFQLLKTFSPENSNYYSVNYETPIWGHRWATGGSISNNTFDIGGELEAFELSGESEEFGGFLKRQLFRGRSFNAYGKLALANKEAKTLNPVGTISQDKLTSNTIEFGLDSIDRKLGGLNQAVVQFVNGSLDVPTSTLETQNSRQQATENFSKTILTLTRLQTIGKTQSLLLRYRQQTSDDLLVSLEQASLGGPDDVRGYPVAEFVRDEHKFFSAEYIFNAPFFSDKQFSKTMTWGQVFQVSVFVDRSEGKINEPLPGELETAKLNATGIALQFNLPGTVFARLEYAKRSTSDDLGEFAAQLDGNQVFLEVDYIF